tara:strand:+ start:470 stop:1240 length:771 start_codon:yes stop_codon:yes gene_type:complete
MKVLRLGQSLCSSGGGAPAIDLDFVITVDTTIAGSSGVGVMNLASAVADAWDCDIDWGDGTSDTGVTSAPSHTYSSAAVYTIRMSGVKVYLNFGNTNDKLKITNIANWGIERVNYLGCFYGCINMTCTATDAPTMETTDIRNMFRSCYVFNGAIGNWSIAPTNMQNCFLSASVFDQNLGDWDVSACTNFGNIGTGNTFSTASLDGIYIGWAAQSLQTAQSIDFGTTKYTGGGAAAAARLVLESAPNNWTVDDGGIA